MKKMFGGINLTWPKLIAMAIIAGVYTAIMAMLPIANDTSFSDLTVTFEVWIFLGIFIIMNSKSAKDSALKCFIFFLISQPLVYLVLSNVNIFQMEILIIVRMVIIMVIQELVVIQVYIMKQVVQYMVQMLELVN